MWVCEEALGVPSCELLAMYMLSAVPHENRGAMSARGFEALLRDRLKPPERGPVVSPRTPDHGRITEAIRTRYERNAPALAMLRVAAAIGGKLRSHTRTMVQSSRVCQVCLCRHLPSG